MSRPAAWALGWPTISTTAAQTTIATARRAGPNPFPSATSRWEFIFIWGWPSRRGLPSILAVIVLGVREGRFQDSTQQRPYPARPGQIPIARSIHGVGLDPSI